MKLPVIITAAAALVVAAGCARINADDDTEYVNYVDTRIGTGGHGHVFLGASVPFGMVQLGPTSIPQSWDWCSGYHDSDSTIIGFSHTHLSGTGIGDLFDVTVMPVVGDVKYERGNPDDVTSGYWSYGLRTSETAEPGYYNVWLERYGVKVGLTATERVGFHSYTYPMSDSSAVVFNLRDGGCWDKPVETHIVAESDSTLSGYRRSTGWAKDQNVYFYAKLSKPFDKFETIGDSCNYARVSFKTGKDENVMMKVAISPVSVEGAKANMEAEIPGWDYEGTREAARRAWNSELGKVKITTGDEDAKRKFYTAMYHTMIVPALFNDVDGNYRGADGEIHRLDSAQNNYTTFSLWDTYRAQMPLLSIVQPARYTDMINTMLRINDQQGRLPVWHLWGNETDCMVGNPGIIPVADAVVKAIPGVDTARALEAIKKTAMNPDRGNGLRMEYGFIPCDKFGEGIAYDMEYAVADGAAANAFAASGDSVTAGYFKNRSQSWRNYFDPDTRFVRGRLSDGSWRTPFSPFAAEHRADDYCEGNAWQYTWLAPQDIEGIEKCFGSREALLEKLDSLFTVSSVVEGADASPDISGLIGQYAHGNEPAHHILYMYTILGQQHKAADRIREVLADLYSADRDGLSGNEDCGQMSAWYILSALGFYEAEPASGRYWFGSPLFDKAEIAVPGGTFTVVAHGNSADNKYISSVKLNGKPYNELFINYSDIMKGGVLELEMTDVIK